VQSQALRELDALMHVARAFEDEAVPLAEGSVDPKRDIENVELELILSDLAVVEKRLERLEKDIKKQKNPALEKEFLVLTQCKAALEKQTPLREVELGAEESKAIRGFTFLSQKPMLYVLNLGEGDAAKANLAGIPHEMILLDLYRALWALDSLTGQTTPDDILNLIFSTFCIGK